MPFTHSLKSLALTSSALCLISTLALADQVILDDLIVDGSACIGFDCVNGESFGFDTIRIKENNLRIHAVDTSNSASFPSNDWQITFNDSSNGGANKFSIDDITGGRTPFTIEASAPNHSLYVDDGGRVGLGTNQPVVELHIPDGDTPTLRLEQNGSSGFTPQTWDVAGNETNFFIRDATNGSKLPFKIKPSAPTNSLFVDTDGDVGLGTASPDARLDVTAPAAAVIAAIFQGAGTKVVDLKSTDNGAVQYRLQSNDGNRRVVALNGAGTTETQIVMDNSEIRLAGATDTGAGLWATISAAGIVTNIGSCTTAAPCDAVFDPDLYTVPSIEAHANQMWDNGYLPAVGPTLQGQPVNVMTKMTRILNELEHAHIYIDQLNQRISQLETQTVIK
ncbi:MAG: hypothetical protein COB16_11570 [Rhodobacteraceae bacterium]|nr:MAG: hypothetical protein COB16_11570 [Paracoccaceae bacterium]